MVMRTLPQKQASEQDDPLTRRIIACAIEVHKRLGPGLLEKLYKGQWLSRWSYVKQSGKNVKVAVE
jgi:hypothetical protein